VSHSRPPKLATFLLERLAGGEPILLGDLEEEYRSGRSRWWYWREALHVVVWSLVGAIRRHPIQFLRAIAGLVIANGVAGFALSASAPFLSSLVMRRMPGWIYGPYQVYTLAWIALTLPITTVAAWSMARLHPNVRVPATLVVVMWSVLNITGDAELHRLWQNMPEPRFVPYLLRHVLGILMWLAAMVVGGMFLPVRVRKSAQT
jgi:hypothetical protein